MKLKKFLSLMVVTFLFLTGCQMGTKDTARENQSPLEETRYSRDDRGMSDRISNNMRTNDGMQTDTRRTSERSGTRYEVAEKAANRIVKEVDQIGQAYVLTSQKNAYVAATLKDSGRTKKKKQDRSMKAKDMTNVKADDRIKGENMTTGDATNKRDRMDSMDRRNYRGDDLSQEVKKEIAKIVKETDKNIENVYVTTSPDFFNLATDYVDDFKNGRPIEGFFDQIGNMIDRVFPQNQR